METTTPKNVQEAKIAEGLASLQAMLNQPAIKFAEISAEKKAAGRSAIIAEATAYLKNI